MGAKRKGRFDDALQALAILSDAAVKMQRADIESTDRAIERQRQDTQARLDRELKREISESELKSSQDLLNISGQQKIDQIQEQGKVESGLIDEKHADLIAVMGYQEVIDMNKIQQMDKNELNKLSILQEYEKYNKGLSHTLTKEQMTLAKDLDIEKMIKSGEIDRDKMRIMQTYDITKIKLMTDEELKKMGVSQEMKKEIIALDQEFTLEKIKNNQEFQTRMQDAQFTHEKEKLTILNEFDKNKFTRDLQVSYPGLKFNADGSPDWSGYEMSSSLENRNRIWEQTDAQLREYNLSTEGTDKDKEDRLKAFTMGMSKGVYSKSPNLDPTISGMMGGDSSAGFLTQADVTDFENWFGGMGGADNPVVLTQLVELGIVDVDALKVDTNGQFFADEKAKELINVSIQGLKAGIEKNTSYMSNTMYNEMQEKDRNAKLLFAQNITQSAPVVQATKIFNSTKTSIGSNIINSQINADTGEMTMQWEGKQTKITDIKKAIKKMKGFKSEAERNEFIDLIDMLASVTTSGEGIENALLIMQAKPHFLTDYLNRANKTLGRAMLTSLNQFQLIDRATKKAAQFTEMPRETAEISRFKSFLQGSDVPNLIQELRKMERGGQEGSVEYNTLMEQIQGQINLDLDNFKANDIELYDDYFNWIELEESVNQLGKIR